MEANGQHALTAVEQGIALAAWQVLGQKSACCDRLHNLSPASQPCCVCAQPSMQSLRCNGMATAQMLFGILSAAVPYSRHMVCSPKQCQNLAAGAQEAERFQDLRSRIGLQPTSGTALQSVASASHIDEGAGPTAFSLPASGNAQVGQPVLRGMKLHWHWELVEGRQRIKPV